MKYTAFHEQRFRTSVSKALQQVQSILDNTRHPRLLEDEDHTYNDKFAVCEFLTNTAIASQMNALESLGLDASKLQVVFDWVHKDKKNVTLRFQAYDSCSFLKEQTVDVAHIEHATETSSTNNTSLTAPSSSGWLGGVGSSASNKAETSKTRVVTKVKEYHWKVEVGYIILLFPGLDPSSTGKSVELISRTSSTIIITSGGQHGQKQPPTPLPEHTQHPNKDVDLTWFFQMISQDQECLFSIDRTSDSAKKTCKTPRRNEDVDAAFAFHGNLYEWAQQTQNFFLVHMEQEILKKHNPVKPVASDAASAPHLVPPGTRAVIVGITKEPSFNGKVVTICEFTSDQQRYRVEPVDPAAPNGLPPTMLIKPQNVKIDTSQGMSFMSSLATADAMFLPIVPILENKVVLPTGDVVELLGEHSRSIDNAIDTLTKLYPPRQLVKLISVAEASIVLLCSHLTRLAESYQDGVDYVEDLLKQQLLQAIGKEIDSKDFDQFMKFHNCKWLAPEYAPLPFTYAIRRPQHDPEGIVSIENVRLKNEPISTMVRCVRGSDCKESRFSSVFIPINAATTIEITGDRFLHGWVQNKFQSKPSNEYQLVARARQFSSFILIIGTIAGPDRFEPKDAIILQNKDEVVVPLLTSTLPSAKDFKDAIASLSPEQQSFAKSFRNMQLESSVFGFCVIQLKPQLEKLLGLPSGSLTKEIQLTQDLMSLFVEYQLPSDLLTFDGSGDSDIVQKVANVKNHVQAVLAVIENEKKKQLQEEERKADMRGELHFTGHDNRSTDDFAGPNGAAPGSVAKYNASMPTPRMMYMASATGAAHVPLSDASKTPSFGNSVDWMLASATPSPRAPKMRMRAVNAQSKRIGNESGTSQSMLDATSSKDTVELQLMPLDSGLEISAIQDFTLIPKILDSKMEKYDDDNALRSTIIKAGRTWIRNRQDNLLTPSKSSQLSAQHINDEKKKAFDMLDAISRSGVLAIDSAELHVIIGVSHVFDNDLIGTVIQNNINPIEKLEKSTLMIATTIYGRSSQELIQDGIETQRLKQTFPALFNEMAP